MSFTNINKSASPTYQKTLRRGRDTIIDDIKNLTFEDEIFSDGTLVKDATFDQFQQTAWANQSKSSAPTYTETTRNA